jgi:uncharacterized membrane protein
MSTEIEAEGPAPTGRTREPIDPTRTVNLSDAIFAIAMTLLVLGLEVPDVGADDLPGALRATAPSLLAFLLAFALVANIWWQHHRLFSRLDHLDGGLVTLNLALLGAVALVPFPTGLLGAHPTSRAGVLPFIGVFALLLALFLALHLRAHRVGAWRRPLPASLAPWVVAGWSLALAVSVVAAAVALVAPIAGLVVLALSGLPEALLARLAPPGYRAWS